MAFQFPLAAVLRYRESIEQREYFTLEQLQQEIVRVEINISQAESALSVATHNRIGDLAQGTRAITLQFAYRYERSLEQEIERLRGLWRELKIKWRHQLASYEVARRNRETLEKLRERQLEVYTREQAKREQAVIDDLFLARRSRSN
jgi:flagellar export protein FliJ